jgi:hypothetical protein
VPAGTTSTTFSINTNTVTVQTIVSITASSGGVSKTAQLSVTP